MLDLLDLPLRFPLPGLASELDHLLAQLELQSMGDIGGLSFQ